MQRQSYRILEGNHRISEMRVILSFAHAAGVSYNRAMKIKPIAKYHIQTSEEIRRIVVALAAEYDTFPSETVSAIRDELKGLFIAGHQSDSKYQENPDATIRRMLRLSDAAGK